MVVYALMTVADPGVVLRVPGHHPKLQDDPGFHETFGLTAKLRHPPFSQENLACHEFYYKI